LLKSLAEHGLTEMTPQAVGFRAATNAAHEAGSPNDI
jgi:hypothetical protein